MKYHIESRNVVVAEFTVDEARALARWIQYWRDHQFVTDRTEPPTVVTEVKNKFLNVS